MTNKEFLLKAINDEDYLLFKELCSDIAYGNLGVCRSHCPISDKCGLDDCCKLSDSEEIKIWMTLKRKEEEQ